MSPSPGDGHTCSAHDEVGGQVYCACGRPLYDGTMPRPGDTPGKAIADLVAAAEAQVAAEAEQP